MISCVRIWHSFCVVELILKREHLWRRFVWCACLSSVVSLSASRNNFILGSCSNLVRCIFIGDGLTNFIEIEKKRNYEDPVWHLRYTKVFGRPIKCTENAASNGCFYEIRFQCLLNETIISTNISLEFNGEATQNATMKVLQNILCHGFTIYLKLVCSNKLQSECCFSSLSLSVTVLLRCEARWYHFIEQLYHLKQVYHIP